MDELKWIKSSYSNGAGGGSCVEVAWVKSSYSNGAGGGSCVETARLEGQQAVRDSKDPAGPMHVFDRASWSAFVTSVKRGEFDLT